MPTHYPNKFLLIIWLCIIFFFCPNFLQAQNNLGLRTGLEDIETLVKSPTKWNLKQGLTFLSISGLTYAAMYFDDDIQKFALENNAYANSIPMQFGRIWGEPWFTGTVGLGLYLQGLAAENSANKNLAFEIGESAFFTGILTLVIKYSFGRTRPRVTNDQFSFLPFSFKNDDYVSFSSGHTALAFALSTVLAKNTNNTFLKMIFYLPASLTAVSRIYQNHHWLSDVIFGGVLGYTVASFITNRHTEKKEFPENPKPSFQLLNFAYPIKY